MNMYLNLLQMAFPMAIVWALIGLGLSSPPDVPTGLGKGYWHTSGSQILDAANTPVRIAGLNWYGFETVRAIPSGLDVQDYKLILQTIRRNGYNTVRLPLSDQMVESPAIPSAIRFTSQSGRPINTGLRGLNSLQILDRIVAEAGKVGLKVILDNHRSEAGDGPESTGLWYTTAYPESAWIADWTFLAHRYRGNPTVIGFDLRNEPHNADNGGACWSCGGTNDWRLAAERAGNAVLTVNPRLLIFVEGTDGFENDYYWWGGNLEGVRTAPVRLKVQHHLVYSAHDYGPSEFGQSWLNTRSTPESLSAVWTRHWAYISQQGIAPVWLGEFGSNQQDHAAPTATDALQGKWFRSLVQFLGKDSRLNWTYWAANADDRYGVLNANYDGPASDSATEDALAAIQFPLDPNSNSGGRAKQDITVVLAASQSEQSSEIASESELTRPSAPVAEQAPLVSQVAIPSPAPESESAQAAEITLPPTPNMTSPAPDTMRDVPRDIARQTSNSNRPVFLTVSAPATATACHVTYIRRRDWGTGFTGDITIRNTGRQTINGWTLTWVYGGDQQLSESWGGKYAQDGSNITFINANWDAAIPAGEELTGIGFNAAYSSNNPLPGRFYLNGQRCD